MWVRKVFYNRLRVGVKVLLLWFSAALYVRHMRSIYRAGVLSRWEANYWYECVRSLEEDSAESLGFCPVVTRSSNASSLSPFFKHNRWTRRNAWRKYLSDEQVLKRVDNCSLDPPWWRRQDDSQVPPTVSLAFSITVHERLGPLETLLRFVSRPGHAVCIHVDAKAPRYFHEDVTRLVDCFRERHPDTDFLLVPNPVKVYWGHISLLQSDLKCLELLLERHHGWEYFLNLAASVLPSHPMDQVESMVAGLGGKSLITGLPINKNFSERIEYVHKLNPKITDYKSLHRTNRKYMPPPHNLTIYKGYREVVLNRTFAEFCVRHPVALSLLKWFQWVGVPDESFFNSLHWVDVDEATGAVRQVPGAFAEPFLVRFTLWEFEVGPRLQCHGKCVRDICQFSMDDLPWLSRETQNSLFVNKFNVELDALALVCWAEMMAHP